MRPLSSLVEDVAVTLKKVFNDLSGSNFHQQFYQYFCLFVRNLNFSGRFLSGRTINKMNENIFQKFNSKAIEKIFTYF